MKIKLIGAATGFLMGFLILHPLSMAFQGLVHPDAGLNIFRMANAFSVHHLPMAFFFGALGAVFGLINVSYAVSLTEEKRRVKELEGLLPICSYCKRIRDDSDTEWGRGTWHRVDHYIARKTDTTFTHGVCPECFERVMAEMAEMDKEDLRDRAEAGVGSHAH